MLKLVVSISLCIAFLAVRASSAAAQALPYPTNPNLAYLGYYFSDGRYGNFTADVFPYTNLFIAITDGAVSTDIADWQTPLGTQMQNAAVQGKHILLIMKDARNNAGAQQYSWDGVLEVAAPYWGAVRLVLIFDDDQSEMDPSDLAAEIAALRGRFSAHGLADRPVMANFALNANGLLNPAAVAALGATGLDVIGVTAFLHHQNFPTPQDAASFLRTSVDAALAEVQAAGKQAFLNMQAFDRSGLFTNIPLLKALQEPIYLAARDNTTVIGIGMFSYARFGGTLDHPELAIHHRRIAAVMGVVPTVANGSFTSLDSAGFPVGWLRFALPAGQPDNWWSTSAGSVAFHRPPNSEQNVIFQQTGVPLSGAFEIGFFMGNTDTIRKRITVIVHEADFSDQAACTFWLPESTSVALFAIRGHTTQSWTNATISFYASTVSNTGNYVLDNVSLLSLPNGSVNVTECEDPFAPAGNGQASGELLTNGSFANGVSSWFTFGNLMWQLTSGVFEFFKLSGTPGGVVFQQTGTNSASGQWIRARFKLGNSSGIRQRVTVLIRANSFDDLHMCSLWIPAGQPLAEYVMDTYVGSPFGWSGTAIDFYPSTVGMSPTAEWLRLDDASLSWRSVGSLGTICYEPGASVPSAAASVSDSFNENTVRKGWARVTESPVTFRESRAPIERGAQLPKRMWHGSVLATERDAGRWFAFIWDGGNSFLVDPRTNISNIIQRQSGAVRPATAAARRGEVMSGRTTSCSNPLRPSG
jgi:hypothetical protein